MKKLLLPVLAIWIVMASLSCADGLALQTRTETIFLEGTEETIITTLVESFRGYSLWIDTNYLTLVPEIEGLGMDLFRRPDIEDIRYEIAIYYGGWLDYSFDEDANITLQTMLDNYAIAEEFDVGDTFTGIVARGFYAMDGDMTYLHYVVQREEGAFHINISFPQEASEGFGSRAIQMLKSFVVIPTLD